MSWSEHSPEHESETQDCGYLPNLQSHEEKDRKLLTHQHWYHITPQLFAYCNEIYIYKGGFARRCSSLVQEVEILFKINKDP